MTSYQIKTREGIRYQYSAVYDPVKKKTVQKYVGSLGRIREPDPAIQLIQAVFTDPEIEGLLRILRQVKGSDQKVAQAILRKISSNTV